jgi:eukaryotic-like serine/threonine-protein kinase
MEILRCCPRCANVHAPENFVTIKKELMAVQTVSHYEILEQLGQGGMGVVYKARDLVLQRVVALKVLPQHALADPDLIIRFAQEARAASALTHANIMTLYEIGEDAAGAPYIAMELIEGTSLGETIAGTPLELPMLLDTAAQLADALDHAHTRGIIHRDIKPANIMLSADGQVKVLDFGLAKMNPALRHVSFDNGPTEVFTDPSLVMGTVQYMSPEQALGREIDQRSDIFSFGIVLYEMCTGRAPFKGISPTETIDRIVHEDPQPIARLNHDIPGDLTRIVRKCLEKDKNFRYQSARDILVDLQSLKRGSGATGRFAIGDRRWSIDAIAVLPFVNGSTDPDTEYLSDGLAESIIRDLSGIPNLKVKSFSSVMRYKGQPQDAEIVGRDLGVQAVLTGRVMDRAGSLMLSVELVAANDNTQLWGHRYRRKMQGIFELEEEIAREVSEQLRITLTGKGEQPIPRRQTASVEAYRSYLKGRYHWNRRMPAETWNAVRHFQEALEHDPTYALAYAGLADAYALLGAYDIMPPKEVLPKAKAAAMHALEIDDDLAEAHTSLAFVKQTLDWDWDGAERDYRRASELNPNYATAHHWYALSLDAGGRHSEALAEMERAQELDPLSLIIHANVGLMHYHMRRFDEAMQQWLSTIAMDPNFVRALWYLGLGYAHQSKFGESIKYLQRAAEVSGRTPFVVATLGYSYGLGGKKEEALKILDELEERSRTSYVSGFAMACPYLGIGDSENAFKWLEKAYEERSTWMLPLRVEPMYDSIRGDRRFADLLRRVGLG